MKKPVIKVIIEAKEWRDEHDTPFFQPEIKLANWHGDTYQLICEHLDGKDIIPFGKKDIAPIIKTLSRILSETETTCLKIGEINKLGIEKSYPCAAFAKIDPNFTKNLWCIHCRERYEKLPTLSMSEIDPKDRIHQIIASTLANQMSGGKKFNTINLSEKIYDLLLSAGLSEIALTTRINSIIIDLLKLEYGIEVE